MNPRVGLQFQHRRVLNDKNQPAVYVVTRISGGVIWFKQPDERKAKECCPLEDWHRVCRDE